MIIVITYELVWTDFLNLCELYKDLSYLQFCVVGPSRTRMIQGRREHASGAGNQNK